MRIKDLSEFIQKSQDMMLKFPERTRFSLKFRNVDKKIVLKVTNDFRCFTYTTSNYKDLKQIEVLNAWFVASSTASGNKQNEKVEEPITETKAPLPPSSASNSASKPAESSPIKAKADSKKRKV